MAILLNNVADPLSNRDVATKNYVDKKYAITTDGGVMYADIKLCVGSDLVRSLGCNDLIAGKKFTFLLGSDTNMPTYSIPNSGLSVPIKIKTDVGFAIMINELPICVFGQDEILSNRSVNMDQHSIKNVMSSVHKFDAVNKAYADLIKYKTATGNIPNIVTTDHNTLHIFHRKSFYQWKDKNM